MDCLDKALIDIRELFDKYDYKDAIMFGHALDGNIHLIVISDFSKKEEIKRV